MPLRIRFSEIVSRSLAARIESMIVMKDASTSGGTKGWGIISVKLCRSWSSQSYKTCYVNERQRIKVSVF